MNHHLLVLPAIYTECQEIKHNERVSLQHYTVTSCVVLIDTVVPLQSVEDLGPRG